MRNIFKSTNSVDRSLVHIAGLHLNRDAKNHKPLKKAKIGSTTTNTLVDVKTKQTRTALQVNDSSLVEEIKVDDDCASSAEKTMKIQQTILKKDVSGLNLLASRQMFDNQSKEEQLISIKRHRKYK